MRKEENVVKKVWEEYRAFLVTVLILAAVYFIGAKIEIPKWFEYLVISGAAYFLGARTANDKPKQ